MISHSFHLVRYLANVHVLKWKSLQPDGRKESTEGNHRHLVKNMILSETEIEILRSEGLCGVIGHCSEPGCCWVFFSAVDRERHTRLVHRKKESRKRGCSESEGTAGSSPAKKAKYTTCSVCDRVFPTPHYLNKHKKEMGHIRKK